MDDKPNVIQGGEIKEADALTPEDFFGVEPTGTEQDQTEEVNNG